jgi:hypothetical protein
MALIKSAQKLPRELYKSLTWDRHSRRMQAFICRVMAKKLADHPRFTLATDVDVSFCDPQSPLSSLQAATAGQCVATRIKRKYQPAFEAVFAKRNRLIRPRTEHGPVQSGPTHVVSSMFLGWFTLRPTKPARFFRHAYSPCRNTRQRHSFSDEPPGYQHTGSPIHLDCPLRDGPTDTRYHDPKKTRWPEAHGCGSPKARWQERGQNRRDASS